MGKRILPLILVLILLLTSCGKAGAPAQDTDVETSDAVAAVSGTHTVTDCAGRTVTVPDDPVSIAGLDPFAGQAIIMLGWGDRMTSTVNGVQRDMLLREMCAELESAAIVKNSGSINAEALLETGTDLIFIKGAEFTGTTEQDKIDALGIPYVIIEYETMEEQMQTMRLIGEVLGETEEAENYCRYYEDSIVRVSDMVKDIPQSGRPRLFHSINEAVRTDSPGSLGAGWIAVTGAVNVSLSEALTISGDNTYATLEQIFLWNPDLIICNESGVDDYILTDSKWAGLSAVRQGRVYQIPIGVSRWGHPSSLETPLAMLWLAEILYPDQLGGEIDLKAEMTQFYQEYYDYTATDETLDAILSGDGIRSASSLTPGAPKNG
ncbi:MAG: ABC transporter substrate-binding protein [Oscillospiraceae bacterium]